MQNYQHNPISRAAIMSFMPFLARIVPEGISKMEKGRYHRDRFLAISKVIDLKYQTSLFF